MKERFIFGFESIVIVVCVWIVLHAIQDRPVTAQPIPAPIAWDARMFTVTIVDPNLSMDPIVCLPKRNHTLDCRDVLGWTGEQ